MCACEKTGGCNFTDSCIPAGHCRKRNYQSPWHSDARWEQHRKRMRKKEKKMSEWMRHLGLYQQYFLFMYRNLFLMLQEMWLLVKRPTSVPNLTKVSSGMKHQVLLAWLWMVTATPSSDPSTGFPTVQTVFTLQVAMKDHFGRWTWGSGSPLSVSPSLEETHVSRYKECTQKNNSCSPM